MLTPTSHSFPLPWQLPVCSLSRSVLLFHRLICVILDSTLRWCGMRQTGVLQAASSSCAPSSCQACFAYPLPVACHHVLAPGSTCSRVRSSHGPFLLPRMRWQHLPLVSPPSWVTRIRLALPRPSLSSVRRNPSQVGPVSFMCGLPVARGTCTFGV